MTAASGGDGSRASSSAGHGDRSSRTPPSAGVSFAFGPFRLFPGQRLLLRDDTPVRLGSRAFDILVALVERAGELLDKDALVARAWPGMAVEESNLRAQVTALRRVLAEGASGDNYVSTVPGRGYRFVAQVARSTGDAVQADAVERAHTLPRRLDRVIGRAEIVAMVCGRLRQHRLITLVGSGGIGKTTVALAVAERLASSFKDGAQFVDLAPLSDPALVPSALAAVLGVAILSENPYSALVAFLKNRQMLLLLDSCEHVVEAAAALAEEVLRGAPRVHVLATSREPLRAEEERVQRLLPLQAPAEAAGLTAAEALAFPAVQLFVERAAASASGYEMTDADAPVVAEICRRLDGIALALELAAARVDAFGVQGVAARLGDRIGLLTHGRRTALPRHQTLSATLDWSYEFLSETERAVLRRLGVFAGRFTREAACAVAQDDRITAADVDDCIADLVDKSLISADVGAAVVYYGLLGTTRAYALKKLTAAGELQAYARRHADHRCDLMARREAEWSAHPGQVSADAQDIDDVRAALDWSFSPGGDAAIGVGLTIAAVPLWTHLSLMQECRRRVEQALASLPPPEDRDGRREMQLFAALGAALMYTKGATPETRAAFARALDRADTLDSTDYRLRALWGLWVDRMNEGAVRDALGLAERFSLAVARSADPISAAVGERMMGFALHFAGDQSAARRHLERMMAGHVPALHERPIARFQFDPWLTARMRLAVISWLTGYPDQASRIVDSGVEEGLAINHAVTFCNALGQGACPTAVLTGDLVSAERHVAMLSDHAERFGLDFWAADARCFEASLLLRRGEVERGLDILRRALHPLSTERPHTRYDAYFGELAEALGRVGDVTEGLATIERALERTERTDGRWYIAELLRIKGELVLMRGAPDADAEAAGCFLTSLDWARRQDALSWELRTAISLARLRARQNRRDDARRDLASVYGRFTEGFATADLRSAAALLASLGA